MSCCNNECLDPVYSNCVEYTGETLTNITNTENLTQIIENIDNLFSNNIAQLLTQNVTVNLQCLANTCEGVVPYTINILNVASGGYILSINTPTLTIGSYSISIRIFQGSEEIGYYTSNLSGISISPTQASNPLGLTIAVEIITNSNSYIYIDNTFLPFNSSTGNIEKTAVCNNNTTVTISLLNFFNLILNEICYLKSQIVE